VLKAQDIAQMIDHSLLKPELSRTDVKQGCATAAQYKTASVCVRPCDLELAAELLTGTPVLPTTVIGFPHGAHTTETKLQEAEQAVASGAKELDMVLNIGRLITGLWDEVYRDIAAVVQTAHRGQAAVKVIFENCFLDHARIIKACQLAEAAGADFVKTSTGFGTGGATLDDLRLMRLHCSEAVRVKAAGGVRTLDAALAVRAAGAVRFGATATEAIMEEALQREAEGILQEIQDSPDNTLG